MMISPNFLENNCTSLPESEILTYKHMPSGPFFIYFYIISILYIYRSLYISWSLEGVEAFVFPSE